MAEMNTKAMYKLSYGLFVCTAVRDGKANGCIINTAIQVASEPNRISVAINKANFTHDMVKETVDLGSHTLFICEPTFMTVLSDVASVTYEYYQNNIKPKPEAVGTTPKGETVWRCRICGYEWVGEELPDDFICPICKHPKADFEKVVR